MRETFFRLLGDLKRGFVATDPKGDGRVIPFTTSSDVVLGDGSTGDVPLAALPAHASTHQNGGSDEISVVGLSGLLADGQTPLAHKTSHQSGGSDAIKLDDLSAPDDNTDLNASASAHGLLPKLSGDASDVLLGDGTFGPSPGGTGAWIPLVDGAEPPTFLTDGDGTLILVNVDV